MRSRRHRTRVSTLGPIDRVKLLEVTKCQSVNFGPKINPARNQVAPDDDRYQRCSASSPTAVSRPEM